MTPSKNNSKNLRSLFIAVLALIFLAALQIAFFNPSFFGLNIFLILILFSVLIKYNKSALLFGWISGILIDTAHFSIFGASSLILLITAFVLIIIYKKAFFALKTENIIFMAFLTVFTYHLTEWIILNGLALLNRGNFESFDSHFVSWNFPIEIITTVFLTLIIFKFLNFSGNE